MSERKPSRVAILDICGTLAPEDSWLALTRDMGADVNRHLEIFHTYREGGITYEESRVQLIGLWRATGRATRSAMREIFTAWPLDPAAMPLVAKLRANGFLPLIITGAVDLYAQVVADRLGVADWYANTPLHFDTDGNLVSYDYDLDQSGKKVRQLEAFCVERGLDPAEAVPLGDGVNDLGLFERTHHGIWLETPDRPDSLRTAAEHVVPNLAAVLPLIEQL